MNIISKRREHKAPNSDLTESVGNCCPRQWHRSRHSIIWSPLEKYPSCSSVLSSYFELNAIALREYLFMSSNQQIQRQNECPDHVNAPEMHSKSKYRSTNIHIQNGNGAISSDSTWRCGQGPFVIIKMVHKIRSIHQIGNGKRQCGRSRRVPPQRVHPLILRKIQ